MGSSDETARRASADRFRQRRATLAADAAGLLGSRAAVDLRDDAAEASALDVAFRRDHADTEGHDWARVSRWWDVGDVGDLTDTLHRLSRNLGSRPVWMLLGGEEPQAMGLASDVVLDNPLGFAALGEGELRLLDQQIPGGLWLRRHSDHSGSEVEHRWEFETWGAEPWLSATTRALRGVG